MPAFNPAAYTIYKLKPIIMKNLTLSFSDPTSNVYTNGGSNGMMNSPIGIGIDGTTMYVAEDGNHCITSFRTYY